MSKNYNQTLQTNNSSLEEIITQLNNLPDAGGGGGDTSIEDSLIERTFTTYTNDRVTTVGAGAFARSVQLTSVNLPNCTTIGTYAFQYCSSLTTVSLPKCTQLNYGAFYSCSNLPAIDFPTCTYVGSSAFYSCTQLTEVNLSACQSLGMSAFAGCSKLTTVILPVCSFIGANAFSQCCIQSLYLLYSGICSLENSYYTFGFGANASIYVPASLVTYYQTNFRWSQYSKYFVAFDGSTTSS